MPSSTFIHYLHHCNLDAWPPTRNWIDRLPKKLNGSLLTVLEPMPFAWGMHVEEGPNLAAIFWTMLVVILVSLGSLSAYVVYKKDVQSATGVGSLVLTVTGLL